MSSDPSEKCSRCGYWLDTDWNYCPECGTKVFWEDPDYVPEQEETEQEE